MHLTAHSAASSLAPFKGLNKFLHIARRTMNTDSSRVRINNIISGSRKFALTGAALFTGAVISLNCAAPQSAQADDNLTLPGWTAALGTGGYFFEANQEYDPGSIYQLTGSYNFNPRWSADAFFSGLPQLNDNPDSGIVPPPADVHNWGLQWGTAANYHFIKDPGRRWDPFAGVGVGIQTFKQEVEGDKTSVFGDLGAGLSYRFNQIWSARGDYKVGIASGDDVKWHQVGLLSVGYSWGSAGAGGSGAGNEDAGKSTIDNKNLGLETIYFDFDKSLLKADAKASLQRNADWIKAHSDTHIILEGHCDERGTTEYNLALGERRAKAAFDFLRSLGVPAAQMTIVSYGEERPADAGHTETAWAKNRRVECRGK